jgi:hypothetical protein
MTLTDPYPPELDDIEVIVPGVVQAGPAPRDRVADALERIATALEQSVLERIQPVQNAPQRPAPGLAPLPPVATPGAPFDGCPIHQVPWKVVPAGVSKKTGKAYDSFRACSVSGCDQRPPR